MESSEAKAFDIQAQVRNNAEVFQSSMKDLFSWEKEIKDKEKGLMENHYSEDISDGLKSLPVRSHVQEQPPRGGKTKAGSSASKSEQKESLKAKSPITEKQDTPLDPVLQKRKEANEHKDRGNQCVKLANYESAIHEYSKAIELFPDDQVFFCNRALCYLRLEKFEECIADCDKAIGLDKLSKKAYYRRMQANESLGNQMDALKDCTTVLTIDPNNSEAKRSLDRINERLRRNIKLPRCPSFSESRDDLIDILPFDKPAYRRSNKALKRINVAEIVSNKSSSHNEPLKISDEDIEKLFNSNCGSFVEVKKEAQSQSQAPKKIIEVLKPETTISGKSNSTEKVAQTLELNESLEKKASLEKTIISPIKKDNEKSQVEDLDNKLNVSPRESSERILPPAPVASSQFYASWRELSTEQKYLYLKSIEIVSLPKILGAGFNPEVLTELLNIIHDFYLPKRDPVTAATLLEISKNTQVNILSLMMSDEDHKVLTRILSYLEASDVSNAVTEQITKNFNLV